MIIRFAILTQKQSKSYYKVFVRGMNSFDVLFIKKLRTRLVVKGERYPYLHIISFKKTTNYKKEFKKYYYALQLTPPQKLSEQKYSWQTKFLVRKNDKSKLISRNKVPTKEICKKHQKVSSASTNFYSNASKIVLRIKTTPDILTQYSSTAPYLCAN